MIVSSRLGRKTALRVGLLLSCSGTALGDGPAAPTTVISLFSIAKSENKNQVQYAVRVDARCAPIPGAPVFAYWRMLEKGPTRTASLLSREFRAYGLASQRVTAQGGDGGEVRIALRATSDRPILVQTSRGAGGSCQALSTMAIAGVPAHLFNVYVRLKWFFGVDYLLLQGWSMDGSHVVKEKLKG